MDKALGPDFYDSTFYLAGVESLT